MIFPIVKWTNVARFYGYLRIVMLLLEECEIKLLLGGYGTCGYGCPYANYGGSSTADNGSSNDKDGLNSYGGNSNCTYGGKAALSTDYAQ